MDSRPDSTRRPVRMTPGLAAVLTMKYLRAARDDLFNRLSWFEKDFQQAFAYADRRSQRVLRQHCRALRESAPALLARLNSAMNVAASYSNPRKRPRAATRAPSRGLLQLRGSSARRRRSA